MWVLDQNIAPLSEVSASAWLGVIVTLIVICVIIPPAAAVIIILIGVYYYVQSLYRPTCREVFRLDVLATYVDILC
jgi:hypothetical protein